MPVKEQIIKVVQVCILQCSMTDLYIYKMVLSMHSLAIMYIQNHKQNISLIK